MVGRSCRSREEVGEGGTPDLPADYAAIQMEMLSTAEAEKEEIHERCPPTIAEEQTCQHWLFCRAPSSFLTGDTGSLPIAFP